MLSKALSAATDGVEATAVEVEVDIAPGFPREQVVGLPRCGGQRKPAPRARGHDQRRLHVAFK